MAVDLLAYLKAGYVAQCHCTTEGALDWVHSQYFQEMSVRFAEDNCTIEVEIAPGLWQPSGYFWEESTLFKRRW